MPSNPRPNPTAVVFRDEAGMRTYRLVYVCWPISDGDPPTVAGTIEVLTGVDEMGARKWDIVEDPPGELVMKGMLAFFAQKQR